MKTKIIIASVIVLAIAAGAFYFFYNKPANKINPNPGASSGIDQLKASLDGQKELKKFSSAEEIKNFFASRPVSQSSGSARDTGLGLWGDSTAKLSAPTEASGLGAGPANNFSTTNVQVAGVDESDLVKTDGNYVYSINNNVVSIIKAVPAADASLVTTIKLDGQGQEIYINKNRLVVFGYDQSVDNDASMRIYFRQNSYVFLSFYDISDQANPKLLKNLKFEGSYTASRLIDNKLYFISTTYNFYPGGDFVLPKVLADGKMISSEKSSNVYSYPEVYYVDSNSAYNASTVSLISLDELDKPLVSQVYMMPAGESIYASAGNLYLTYTKYLSDYQLRMSVARDFLFDKLSQEDQARITAIANIDSAILSDDEKAMKVNQVIDNFLARLEVGARDTLIKQLDDEFAQRYKDVYKELEKTVIHKISLDNGSLTYKGSAEVSGRVLNQFSMDEYKGYFRVATTRSQSWMMPLAASFRKMPAPEQTQELYNNVYTLDDQLALAGTIENLAPGERIYSVRFLGDRGYVVTFKQTDPLFVLDLKNPAQPIVAGQLKIPGFSSYLHPYKENMLIGVGKEATDNGVQGVDVRGIKLSLFDVTDMTNPKEVTSLGLGGRGSDTAVLFDHKAFLFIPDKDLVAIPMSLTKADSSNYAPEFQGLGVFKIEADKITELGRIAHPLSEAQKASGYTGSEMISRSLYIGDYLYTLSPTMFGVHQLVDLKNIKTINLPTLDAPIQGTPVPILYEKPLVK
ncbi:MAG: beta-propeller domain-containing protein [Candidatus Falkowbacteria bacterium]|nr:beta-propeller domain-containing protein [Candidatus Falkowbacteria bacterium]